MDAIKFLKQQHNEVEDLFEEFENSESDEEKQSLFEEIADDLAIHATIEERYFYPAVRAKQTEGVITPRFELDAVVALLFALADGIALQLLSGLPYRVLLALGVELGLKLLGHVLQAPQSVSAGSCYCLGQVSHIGGYSPWL